MIGRAPIPESSTALRIIASGVWRRMRVPPWLPAYRRSEHDFDPAVAPNGRSTLVQYLSTVAHSIASAHAFLAIEAGALDVEQLMNVRSKRHARPICGSIGVGGCVASLVVIGRACRCSGGLTHKPTVALGKKTVGPLERRNSLVKR